MQTNKAQSLPPRTNLFKTDQFHPPFKFLFHSARKQKQQNKSNK